MLTINQKALAIGAFALVIIVSGCSDSSSSRSTPPTVSPGPTEPDPITISGLVMDGPVQGGSVYLFDASQIDSVLSDAEDAEDRAASLSGAAPIAVISREEADEAEFEVEISGDLAGDALFLVFDSAGAEDLIFGDEPFNLESVVVLGSAGDSHIVNITPHTSVIAQQVRTVLDLTDTGISADTVATEIQTATTNITTALGIDEFGERFLPVDTDIIALEDEDLLEAASTSLGMAVRTTAALLDTERESVLASLGLDALDGEIDGVTSGDIDLDEEMLAEIEEIADITSAGRVDTADFVIGSCASSAAVLGSACEADTVDDFLEGKAICQDTSDQEEYAECIAEVELAADEQIEECEDVLEARLELCDDLDDAVHEPEFGADFADNFVDPLTIGDTTEVNPWFPLVVGNQWIYEGTFEDDEGEQVTETITVTVTDRTKLIDGITCLVVVDEAMEDDVVIEATDDWYAQDVEGNVWYCGEISQEFETFDGDDPELPELVEIEGSWKSGRDGAEAGILIPMDPEVGDIFRQEVLFGEAEDVVEILSLEGTETSPAASCESTCLVTQDTTPLEPDVEENKYYISGIGLIVEVDLESGERVELQSFTLNQ